MPTILLYGDGGSRGNPGKAASGFVIYEEIKKEQVKTKKASGSLFDPQTQDSISTRDKESSGNELVFKGGKYLGITTNNQAEWQALTLGMEKIIEMYTASEIYLKVFLDSELVIKQAKGIYRVKNLDLKPHFEKLKILQKSFQKVEFNHVFREFNKEADRAVNEILDEN